MAQQTCNVGTWVQSLAQEDPLEVGRETHSSILAWEIPWTSSGAQLSHLLLHEAL